jgi:hypothetical protein
MVKVELSEGLSPESSNNIATEIEEKIHDSLRFRAELTLVPQGTLNSDVGQTYKSQLIEKAYENGETWKD